MARWDEDWHKRLDRELAELAWRTPTERCAIRRALGQDLIAFALIYFREHLQPPADPAEPDADRPVSFASCHYEWAELAERWMDGETLEPAEDRHGIVAPRETGKSTWWYLVIPAWAGAYGYRRFVAAFTHATSQAEQHLMTFNRERENNALLLADFPEFCAPARKQSGSTVADRAGLLHCANGFTFGARGIDSAVLGMKVGNIRPDLIVMDDIEPDEARYSAELARKRLGTVLDAILPINIRASVIIVGTVQIPGSIVHTLVRYAKGDRDEETEWVARERFQPHWHRALVELADGGLASLWPQKWPLEYLLGIQGTRSYQKNYDNDPPDADGVWWRVDDIGYDPGEPDDWERRVLFVDGAVTKKATSDYTGLAVVALDPHERRFYVLEALEVRLTGEPRRRKVLDLIEEHQIRYVMVEANQGGDLWYTELHGLPVKVVTFTQSERKETRLDRLRAMYQKSGQPVRHVRRLATYERRLLAYPNVEHDDVIDAVAAAIEHLTWILLKLLGRVGSQAAVRQYAYTANTIKARRGAD
jgi:predicted phage terminase large subunit-like protein